MSEPKVVYVIECEDCDEILGHKAAVKGSNPREALRSFKEWFHGTENPAVTITLYSNHWEVL